MAGTYLPWVVFFGGLLTAGFGVVMGLSGEAWGWGVAALSAAASSWALWVQARFSPRQTARVLGAVVCVGGLLTALIGGSVGSMVTAGIGSGLLVASAVGLFFGLRRVTNPVRGLHEAAQLRSFYESDSVHFALGWRDVRIARGDSFVVELLAQNVVDVPRAIRLQLDGVGEHGFETTSFSYELPPGEIVSLAIPFRVNALASGTLSFAIEVSAHGEQTGRRLRPERGAEWVANIAAANLLGAVTLLTLGVGTFRWGGTRTATVTIDEQAPLVSERKQLVVTKIWTPTAQDVAAAARL